jgi:flagellin-like hook-associated protein FlgL
MSSFVPGLNRVPDLLIRQTSLSSITRVNASLFTVQNKLSTGLDLTRPSEDPVRAAAIAELDENLERSAQRMRNLEVSEGALNVLDTALGEATNLAQEARSLALAQLSAGSSTDERRAQATVVNSMIDSLLRISNRESLVGYIFGGTEPGREPIEEFNGAYRFVGGIGSGLTPDLSTGRSIPVTLGAANAVGAVSGRVQGAVDLQPALTDDTRLDDLRGARNLGIGEGSIEIEIGAAVPLSVDLSGAETIGDVTDLIAAAIIDYETLNGVSILGPNGVGLDGGSITVDALQPVEFSDVPGSTAATDLGLVGTPTGRFDPLNASGVDLRPALTLRTPVNALRGLAAPLGSITVSNNGVSRDIDLSGAESVGEIKSLIESANLGVRVSVNDDGTGINIISELSTASDRALSISETGGGTLTATALGIRSFARETRIEDMNFGRGVEVLSENADPALDVDFEIELGDGFTIAIDLNPADMTTIGSVIDTVNEQIDAALTAAGRPTTDASVGLADGANGLVVNQDGAITGAVTINQRNNSPAAIQLGLTGGSWDAGSNRWQGEDTATVRVESLFTHLIDLRNALEGDDTFGMSLAADGVNDSARRLTQSRALVGGFAQRVSNEQTREQERNAVDTQVRGGLRDADFAEAATEFAQLQTQLEASLRVAGLSGQLNLLSFLG